MQDPATALSAERSRKRTFAQLAGVAVVAELHRQLDDAPDADGDEAHAADARHDLLQVGHVVCALQQEGVQLTAPLRTGRKGPQMT